MASGHSVGSIHYDVGLDTTKFDAAQAGINAKVGSIGDKFNGVAGVVGDFAKKTGIAMAATGLALGALTTKMLLSGANLEQQLGGAEAVFGQYADSIKQTAAEAYSQAGLSQAEFLQGANKMGSLFQGAGFSVQQSMKMSGESMQRASDIASIMGISTTEALEAVSGMAKGNFTMMDNLGVAMNDTAIAAFAASKGIDASTGSMTIQEKVGLAQQMFMEKTAKYAGNYAKENQTLAGSINSTKKAFDNLISGQGEIDGFIELLINTIELAVPQIIKILPKIVSGISAILSSLVPALSAALPQLLPPLIGAIVSLLQALVAAFPTIMNALLGAMPMVIDAFIQLFLAIVKALPQIVTTIAQAMPTLITALVNGLTNPEALTAIIMGAVQLLLALVQAIPIIIPALVAAIPIILKNLYAVLTSTPFMLAMISAGVQLVKSVISGMISIMSSVINAAWSVVNIIASVMSPGNMLRIGGDMIRGLAQGIANNAGSVIEKVKEVCRNALDSVKKFFGIKSPSKLMAKQGNFIMQGLGAGIENGTRGVITAAQASAATISNQLSAQGNVDMAMQTGSRATLAGAVSGGMGGGASTRYGDNNITIGQINNTEDADYLLRRINRNSELESMGASPA